MKGWHDYRGRGGQDQQRSQERLLPNSMGDNMIDPHLAIASVLSKGVSRFELHAVKPAEWLLAQDLFKFLEGCGSPPYLYQMQQLTLAC